VTEKTATILVVEDDIDVADMLDAYFRVQGYEVLVANWGEEAIQTCHDRSPELVILDIRLPDIDGYKVARRLRESRRTASIPILFLTEKRELGDKLKGLALGADDYITKPFDIQELRLRVRNALRRASQGSLTNPITSLPEGRLVDERLQECLGAKDWALLAISLENLESFREAYGFVASDDVLRAIGLMIQNAVRSNGAINDFLGQLENTVFLVVTTRTHLPELTSRIRQRLEQALDYFYPLRDRLNDTIIQNRLFLRTAQLDSDETSFDHLEQLKVELAQRLS
jgi:DNA-binding response OmpR family regulator